MNGKWRGQGEVLARREDLSPMHTAVLSLLMLTGCRRPEIVGPAREELKGRQLRPHDSKIGPRRAWLGVQELAP